MLAIALVAGAAAFTPVGPATGFRVSITGTDGDIARNAFDSAAAYNADRAEYLVTYEADGLTTDGEVEIFAQRVTRQGNLIGGRIRVSSLGPNGDASHDASDAAPVYNPKLKQYLVVFEGDGLATVNEDEIWGQRLSATGVEIGTDFRISTTDADGDANFDATDPDVAYNSKANQYLAVWEADSQGTQNEDEIYAQRLSGARLQALDHSPRRRRHPRCGRRGGRLQLEAEPVPGGLGGGRACDRGGHRDLRAAPRRRRRRAGR